MVCQRWFVHPKIPDPRTGVVGMPYCYMDWLDQFGPFRDTPEKQAEYLAMSYGKGGLMVGWQNSKKDSKGKRCKEAAQSAAAQANNRKTINNKPGGNLCKACGNRKADGKKTNPKARAPCAACAAKRAAKAATAAKAAPPT